MIHTNQQDFPNDESIAHAIEYLNQKAKIIAAVSHGVAAFVNSKLHSFIRNRHITCFTNKEEHDIPFFYSRMPFLLQTRLETMQTQFHAGENWSINVQLSATIVTGQNVQSAKEVAKQVVFLIGKTVPSNYYFSIRRSTGISKVRKYFPNLMVAGTGVGLLFAPFCLRLVHCYQFLKGRF